MPPTNRPTWPVLALVTAGMGAGPLLNFGLASTSSLVIATFGLTTAQFGLILTVVFASAAVVSLALGWLADRLAPPAQWGILFGGAAIALGLAGLAPTYGFLLATAVFSGVSQAMSNPTTNRAVTALAPPAKRIGWIGVKQSGVQVGQLFAGLAFPGLALWLGWTGAALAVSALCIAMLVAALTVIPDWTKGTSGVTETSPTPTANDVPGTEPATSTVAPSPRMVWLIVGMLAALSFLSAFGLMSTNSYLSLFAVQQFDYPLVLGGLLVAMGGLIGVASRIWWAQALVRGAGAGPLLVIMSLGSIAAAVCFTVSALAHVDALIWLGVALHGISVLGANVVINASVIKVAGRRRLGLATGVTSTGLYAGFATGPVLAGAVIDSDVGFTGGWAVIGAAYVVCLGVALVFSRMTRHLRPPRRR
ncbi:MFS transporter [Pseudoclavibacter endophyticus]|uniref:MFS transporter n=1 Tax=Pseudoclavibacter endophyticus TaxID=1778590 RepID=UPI0016661E81|nr:MFS transporter [Pseudoclavibacter endophyticus]